MNGFGSRVLSVLGVLCLCAGGAALYQQSITEVPDEDLQARLIRTSRTPTTWKIIDVAEVQSGATIPASTNVVFHLPLDMDPTPAIVLLGQEGARVRYWGYCFGDNYNPETVANRVARGQLPGLIFLSEAEQAERQRQADLKKPVFDLVHPPTTQEELDAALAPADTNGIRNQIDVFQPGAVCFIMTEDALGIAVDSDRDLLNNKLERELGTKVDNTDTDSDGISDGVEFLHGLLPKVRDSDGDGIIDGIEDKNWNGLTDRGETSPLSRDSDKDGLCDGSCTTKRPGRTELFLGEDVNLNGTIDGGETNPLKWSSRNDGVSDYQAYLNCQLNMREYCTK